MNLTLSLLGSYPRNQILLMISWQASTMKKNDQSHVE